MSEYVIDWPYNASQNNVSARHQSLWEFTKELYEEGVQGDDLGKSHFINLVLMT